MQTTEAARALRPSSSPVSPKKSPGPSCAMTTSPSRTKEEIVIFGFDRAAEGGEREIVRDQERSFEVVEGRWRSFGGRSEVV